MNQHLDNTPASDQIGTVPADAILELTLDDLLAVAGGPQVVNDGAV